MAISVLPQREVWGKEVASGRWEPEMSGHRDCDKIGVWRAATRGHRRCPMLFNLDGSAHLTHSNRNKYWRCFQSDRFRSLQFFASHPLQFLYPLLYLYLLSFKMSALAAARYGKDNVRVCKVIRDEKTGIQTVVEMTVCVLLEGDIETS